MGDQGVKSCEIVERFSAVESPCGEPATHVLVWGIGGREWDVCRPHYRKGQARRAKWLREQHGMNEDDYFAAVGSRDR